MGFDEMKIYDAHLIEISDFCKLPVSEIYDKQNEIIDAEKQEKIREEELKEFQRLKDKYNL